MVHGNTTIVFALDCPGYGNIRGYRACQAGEIFLKSFYSRFNNIILFVSDHAVIRGVRDGMQKVFKDLAAKFKFQKPFRIAVGGAERQDSVWNGLEALTPKAEIVAIHDAARPCTSKELIAATVKAAEETGAAVAAQPLTDTIKESADGKLIQRMLDRSRLWAVQTPQTFRVEVIRRALTEARRRKLVFTDDTAACELIGQPVRLVSSIAPNPKVTVVGDLPFIEILLRGKT